MNIYLAGISSLMTNLLSNELKPNDIMVLESYYSFNKKLIPFIGQFKSFLLDSGAFTFMSNKNKYKKFTM